MKSFDLACLSIYESMPKLDTRWSVRDDLYLAIRDRLVQLGTYRALDGWSWVSQNINLAYHQELEEVINKT